MTQTVTGAGAQASVPTLVSSDTTLVVRKARKQWRCICANEFRRFEVITYHDGVPAAPIYKPTRHAAEVTAEYLLLSPGTEAAHVHPVRNPNYRSDCLVDIQPGDTYIEYLAEAEPFSHGSSYCVTCAVAVWDEIEVVS
jgi:hypothetical protein